MIPKENIKGVLFDFGGTLAYDEPSYAEGFARMCTAAGYPTDLAKYRAASSQAKQNLSEEPRELEPWREWRMLWKRELFRQLGVPEDQVEYMVKVMEQRFRYYSRAVCYAETHFTLRALRRAGYTVGVISNIAPGLPLVLDELDLTQYLKFLIASDTFGAAKPDPSFFQEGLRLAELPAEACMYVGDSIECDVDGSMPLGMQPVFIDRFGTDFEREGVLKVTNLVEILDWLGIDCWDDEALHDVVPSR